MLKNIIFVTRGGIEPPIFETKTRRPAIRPPGNITSVVHPGFEPGLSFRCFFEAKTRRVANYTSGQFQYFKLNLPRLEDKSFSKKEHKKNPFKIKFERVKVSLYKVSISSY